MKKNNLKTQAGYVRMGFAGLKCQEKQRDHYDHLFHVNNFIPPGRASSYLLPPLWKKPLVSG